MLNGKRYFAEFPDEDPALRRKLRSPELMATLKALEQELRPHIRDELATRIDGRDVNQDLR
jgi:hypothetical protein